MFATMFATGMMILLTLLFFAGGIIEALQPD